MLRDFSTAYGGTVTDIEAALDAQKFEEAATQLHRLRGAAGAIGATDLEQSARQLEDSLRSYGRADPDLRVRFVGAGAGTMATRSSLNLPVPEENATADGRESPQPAASPDMANGLETLEELLASGNSRALDYLPWLNRRIGIDLPEGYRAVAQQIDELDFEDALRALRNLANSDRD